MLDGSFTRPRSRAGMKATVEKSAKRPHSSADTRRRTSVDADTTPSKKSDTDNDDWLELALGGDAKTSTKPKEGKTDAAWEDSKKMPDSSDKTEVEKKVASSASSGADYLGLGGADYLGLGGDDIDPDTLVR